MQRNAQPHGHLKAASLRAVVSSAIDQHLYSTATSFASQLTQLPDALPSDFVLFARTFLLSGEHRRCLATLEHRGLLAADNLLRISRFIGIKDISHNAATDVKMQELIGLLSAVLLAATCLLSLQEHHDCVTLLAPIIGEVEAVHGDSEKMALFYQRAELFSCGVETDINPISCIFSMAGRCMDMLENRPKAQLLLTVALRVDPICTEAIDYLIRNCLIGQREKNLIVEQALNVCKKRKIGWLESFYRELQQHSSSVLTTSTAEQAVAENATTLARRADYMYSRCRPEEAYRHAREAYIMDPFDWDGAVLVYIVSMVELGLKTELFYLGHELAQSHPDHAMTWYCIGCYYWCCKNLTMAQAFLQKSTKLDKRFARSWVALGHVLVAAEESEHAISAYRAACRLLPGDHRAPTFLAKELIRTNNVTLAVHILQGAHQLCPDDPITLNELGVAALTLGNISEALHYFEQAVRIVSQFEGNYKYIDSEEIFCNYGTCLRRASRLEDALLIYQRCLSMNPRSTENHANVGFTLHLLKRFSDAIEYYHTVLGFEPAHAFCSEMLNNAIEDSLSLSGANDRGPVSLLFGSSLAADSRSGNNDAVSGDDMVLSPLLNKGSDNTVGIFGMDDRSSIMPVDSPVLHTKRFANDSEIVSSVQSESRVRFDTSGAEMSGRRTEQGRNFNLFNHSGQPETPYSDSGSVCPFPGFGMPSTGATAKIRNDVSLGHAATPDFSDRGTAARIGEIGTAGSVDYSPYSYINAVGGARRVSFNTSNPAGSAAPTAHMGGIELSGIYSEGTEESRTEFELCGDVADSFHSSPSVMSFSRVTGNMSWSADGDTTPRDEDA